jgi:hypothetical protein
MKGRGFQLKYMEVDADHGRMVALVLPAVFKFFDRLTDYWIPFVDTCHCVS